MATIKVKFRKSSIAGKPGSIYYQICHDGQVKLLSAHIHLSAAYWDSDNQCIVSNIADSSLSSMLGEYRLKIESDLSRLRFIFSEFNSRGDKYSLSEVLSSFQKPTNDNSVFAFFKEQIKACRRNKQLGTARNYERTLNSLRNFLKGNDIPFTMITENLILEYEKWLAIRDVKRNSRSFYIRNVRSIYNKAVKRKYTEQQFPFNNAYTGIDRTRKRAVDEGVIIRLLELNLGYSKALSLTRDLFVFSYCTRGMSFIDIAFLRKTDVTNGVISYIRHKTKQQLNIRIEPCMERVIKRYEADTAGSPYVFPIITASEPETAYRQYQVALNYHNRKLKRLGDAIGEALSISSYTARHTWATTARKHNIPIAIISEGMGHTSEKTTQIYLASLENSVIDEANKGLLGKLNCMVSS